MLAKLASASGSFYRLPSSKLGGVRAEARNNPMLAKPVAPIDSGASSEDNPIDRLLMVRPDLHVLINEGLKESGPERVTIGLRLARAF